MADFVYEISCSGERGLEDAVRSWADAVAIPAWIGLAGLTAIDSYVMAKCGAHDPFVDDGAGPLLLAMLHFATAEQMSHSITALARSLDDLPHGVAITGTLFERRLYPIGGETMPGPLTAPFSYVVRYHRPADNEAEFVAHYLADHPPLLAKLPEIRSVLCYLPLDIPTVLPAANVMIGNEVAFDSPEAFSAAMASPVRAELRAHFRTFPKFTGRNTHYPMMRRQLTSSAQRPA